MTCSKSVIVQSVQLLVTLYLMTIAATLFANDSEIITTIILINRQAELVDLDEEGEVLKRHIAIPDYFTSGRSHSRSLKNSIERSKGYGHFISPKTHFISGSSDLLSEDLQSFLVDCIKSVHLSKVSNTRTHNLPPILTSGTHVFTTDRQPVRTNTDDLFGNSKKKVFRRRNITELHKAEKRRQLIFDLERFEQGRSDSHIALQKTSKATSCRIV